MRGVEGVEQGCVRYDPPFEAFSEAVILSFDPTEIRLVDLINIHLHTHSSTSQHRLRSKYRSAIASDEVVSSPSYASRILRLVLLAPDI